MKMTINESGVLGCIADGVEDERMLSALLSKLSPRTKEVADVLLGGSTEDAEVLRVANAFKRKFREVARA